MFLFLAERFLLSQSLVVLGRRELTHHLLLSAVKAARVCTSGYRLDEQAPHSISLLTSRSSPPDHVAIFVQPLSFRPWEEAHSRALLNFDGFPAVHCTGEQAEPTGDHLPLSSIFFPYT